VPSFDGGEAAGARQNGTVTVTAAKTDIRTPDQRLRVFVSSTLGELAEERAAAARAIEALRLTPVLFELGARPHPPRELYRAYLAQSDVFIGLYWQRYGWIGPDMEISGLEDEFLLSDGMPRLLYVKTPAPDREPGLTAMIERLQSTGSESYRSFRDCDELDRLVRDDLALLLSERFAAAGDAAPAAPARSRTLPVPSTSLVGRDQDIADATELLGAPDVRLVTITGAGGIGKTRLALAVGEAIESAHPGRVTFVSLGAVTEHDLVLPRIATATGAASEGPRPVLDVLAEHLADDETLLVLDNLEQVISVAPQLDDLLARCRRLRILATSRAPLRLRAEHEYPVAPLDVPPTSTHVSAEAIASCSCVQLFVERARAVRHDFTLTDDDAAAVAQLCQRLDGLPLAIELAAARTRLLRPKDLLARLETSLDALGSGPVDLPDRQRTLRATVEWSIGLLGDPLRDLLAILSVFVDGWTLDAATRVADTPEDEVLDLLDALAGHSLVTVDASAAGVRFRMLESVREIASELRATRGDQSRVAANHAACYRDLVIGMDWPGDRQAEWAERLRVEEGNIRASIHWFLDNDVTPLPHMFRSLWLFWQMQDRMPDGRQWITELLEKVDSFDPQSKVELLLTSAMTAVEVGDDHTALSTARAIEELDDPIDDPFLASSLQLALAWIRPIEDDDEGGLRAAVTAFDGYLAHDESVGASGAAMSAGMLAMNLGRADEARRWFGEVERLGGRSGNNWLEQGTRTQRSLLEIADGNLDEARKLVTSAVDVDDVDQLSTYTLAFALNSLAHLALAEGRPGDAAHALGAANGLRERAGIRTWPSARRNEAALVAKVQEALDEASYRDAFAAGRELDPLAAVELLRGAG
jgi:predicted ATPase